MFINTFRYTPEDVDCRLCTAFTRKDGCTAPRCLYLAERIEAGVVGYDELLRESFPATFGSLYDESEVPVAAEASYREVENEQPEIGAMQPRKLKPKKEQPEPFAVETTDTNDDPFGGDAE